MAQQIIGFVQALRKEELEKTPGIAEFLDFSAALMWLGNSDPNDGLQVLRATLVALLKTQSDRANVPIEVVQRLAGKAA